MVALVGAMLANFVVNKTNKKIKEQYEVILYTLSLCNHCAVFETDVVKTYKSHTLAKYARLVHVNMDDQGQGPYHLKAPIISVPTAIIMKNGKEQARLNGLVEPAFFYSFVRDQTVP